MLQYQTVNELIESYAANNLANGIVNDMNSEKDFIKSSVVSFKNRLDAIIKYSIDSKIYVIDSFGFVKIN